MQYAEQRGSAVPPHSVDAERAVLGAVLRDAEVMTLVADSLDSSNFFLDAHQRIYAAMSELYKNNEAADILTVAEQLRVSGYESQQLGPAYLIELTETCPIAQNIEHYAAIVRRYYYLRRIIATCQDTIKSALACDGSVESFIEDVEKEFLSIAGESDKQGIVLADQVLDLTLDEIQKSLNRGTETSGIPTGFYELDALTGGWQRSDLIILAARPGMGKTALALNCAAHAARSGLTVVVFTLEMRKEQLMARILSSEARVDSGRLRRGELSDEEMDRLMEGAKKVYEYKTRLGIDETPSITLMELRSRCRRFQRQHGLDFIIIDYLQLMSGSGSKKQESREREISEISMGLKSLAKELHVPVMALAQLNRGVESRPDKRPKVSDLRESGSLEQDADQIMFVYRDEYYNPGSEKAGVSELIIGKNRHGSTSTIDLAFQPNFVSFQNLMKV